MIGGSRGTRASTCITRRPTRVAQSHRSLVQHLARATLAGASFTYFRALREAIDQFIDARKLEAHPFEWTKEIVPQVPLKQRYVNLLK
jgi:hypothetical protein